MDLSVENWESINLCLSAIHRGGGVQIKNGMAQLAAKYAPKSKF